VTPWPRQPDPLALDPAGSAGDDRLRLRFSIDASCRLSLEINDLLCPTAAPTTLVLGDLR